MSWKICFVLLSLLLLFVITSCLMMHIVSLEDTIFSQFGSDHEELLLSFRQVLSFNLDRLLDWHTASRTDLDTVLCSKWALFNDWLCLVTKQKPRVKTQRHLHYESRWLWCLPFQIQRFYFSDTCFVFFLKITESLSFWNVQVKEAVHHTT